MCREPLILYTYMCWYNFHWEQNCVELPVCLYRNNVLNDIIIHIIMCKNVVYCIHQCVYTAAFNTHLILNGCHVMHSCVKMSVIQCILSTKWHGYRFTKVPTQKVKLHNTFEFLWLSNSYSCKKGEVSV